MNRWIDSYILTAFKMDKYFKQNLGSYYVDGFIGDRKAYEKRISEDAISTSDLIKDVQFLKDTLCAQNFEEPRKKCFENQLNSMETIVNILMGSDMTFCDMVSGCLDMEPVKVPDERLEQALQLYDEALSGEGSLGERYSKWVKRNDISMLAAETIKEIIETIFVEIRRRTDRLLGLPCDEVEIEVVENKNYGAANWYLGNYKSIMQINRSRSINLFYLLPLMCHEVYSGHHTEYALKEKHLLNEKKYYENMLFTILNPQLVVTEGIGEIAFQMLFTPEEAAEWMRENLYKKLNMDVSDVDLVKLYRACTINGPDQLCGNIILMLNGGVSEEEIIGYITKYALFPEEKAKMFLEVNRSSVFSQIYNLCYSNGKRMLLDLIHSSKDKNIYKKIMSEPMYPSLINQLLNGSKDM